MWILHCRHVIIIIIIGYMWSPTFKMIGARPAISKEAFLNFREGGSDSRVVIFSFFIFSRLHLFGLVWTRRSAPAPRSRSYLKGLLTLSLCPSGSISLVITTWWVLREADISLPLSCARLILRLLASSLDLIVCFFHVIPKHHSAWMELGDSCESERTSLKRVEP